MDTELMEIKPANKALYFTAAVITLVVTTLGAIVFVSTRANGQDNAVLIGGIIAFVGPAVTALLALLATLDNKDDIQNVKKTVNGTVTNLASQVTQIAQENAALTREVTAAQFATSEAQNATRDSQSETARIQTDRR